MDGGFYLVKFWIILSLFLFFISGFNMNTAAFFLIPLFFFCLLWHLCPRKNKSMLELSMCFLDVYARAQQTAGVAIHCRIGTSQNRY